MTGLNNCVTILGASSFSRRGKRKTVRSSSKAVWSSVTVDTR